MQHRLTRNDPQTTDDRTVIIVLVSGLGLMHLLDMLSDLYPRVLHHARRYLQDKCSNASGQDPRY